MSNVIQIRKKIYHDIEKQIEKIRKTKEEIDKCLTELKQLCSSVNKEDV